MPSPLPIAVGPCSNWMSVCLVLVWLVSLLPLTLLLLLDAGMDWVIFVIQQEIFEGLCGQSVVTTLTFWGCNWVRFAFVLLALTFWLACLLLTYRWSKRAETKRLDQWLIIGAVYVASLGMVLSQIPFLLETGAYWRVSYAAPKFYAIAQDLFDDWPNQILEHPRLGTVGLHPDNPDRLFLLSRRGKSFDFRDDLGIGITRTPTGEALDIELDTYVMNGNMYSRVIVMKSPGEISVDELLRTLNIDRTRCYRIDSRMFFVP